MHGCRRAQTVGNRYYHGNLYWRQENREYNFNLTVSVQLQPVNTPMYIL